MKDTASPGRMAIAAEAHAPELECLVAQPRGPARGRVLLVHGAYTDAWCWAPTYLGGLARRGWAAYALSLRGHGGSGGRPSLDHWSIDDYAHDLRRALHAIGDAAIIASSMGGFVVQRHLLDHAATGPVVVLGSVPPSGTSLAHFVHLMGDPQARRALLPVLQSGSASRAWVEMLAVRPLPEAALAVLAEHTQRESARALFDLMGGLPRAKLARVRVQPRTATPMLALAGARDAVVPPSALHEFGRVWHAQTGLLDGMGHAPMLEQDWEPVLDGIVAWMAAAQ